MDLGQLDSIQWICYDKKLLIEIGPYAKELSGMILHFQHIRFKSIELCQLFVLQDILVIFQLENSELFQISIKEGFAFHLGGRLCFCLRGFSSVVSDHRVVTVESKLSLRIPKSPPPKKRYDWRLLKIGKDLCSRFTIVCKALVPPKILEKFWSPPPLFPPPQT